MLDPMFVRLVLSAAFVFCVPLLAQPNIVRDEHDRRIRNETERNTKYHNNADDYSKRTPTPTPVRRAPVSTRPTYVPPTYAPAHTPVSTSINRTYTPAPVTQAPPLSPSLYHTADAELAQAETQLFASGFTSTQTAAALSTIQARVSQGFPRAQFLLGRAYELGLGHLIDNAEALRLYQMSAQLGDTRATYRLAMVHWNGELDNPVDGRFFQSYLKEPIAAGDAEFNYMLGDAYRTGTHALPFDRVRAVQYYEVAANHGSNMARARLADIYFRGAGVAQDFNKSAQWAQQALAAQPIGAAILAYLYRAGVGGLPKDPAKSVEMMKDASARGDVVAQAELAHGFDGNPPASGNGLPYSEMKRLEEAAALELPPMYQRAAGVFQKLSAANPRPTSVQVAKFQKAANELDKAANEKDKLKQTKEVAKIDWQAVFMLGRAYLHGDGVDLNRERARFLLNWACHSGHTQEACVQLTWAYYFQDREEKAAGKPAGSSMLSVTAASIDRDAPSAVTNYLRAIGDITLFYTVEEQRDSLRSAASLGAGISDAQIELGYIHLKGAPGEKEEGLRNMELAAKSDPNGMYALGAVLANGFYGVPADRPRALELFRAAAAQDQVNAQHMLAVAYQKGIAVEMDHPVALQWAMKAALAGQAKDQLIVARLLQNGIGVPHDAAKSLEWMQKAAANGEPLARAEVAKGFTGQ